MILSQDYIIPELRARERFDAIRELVSRLVQTGLIQIEDQDAVVGGFIQRENIMSTGGGFGLATPVARSNAVTDVVMAFGRSSSGIEWHSLDSQPATFILMFINPPFSSAYEKEYRRF